VSPAGRARGLHVHARGDPAAPRIVFLHGVTGFGGHARTLAERSLGGYRVLAPDLLGHGSSRYEPPWSITEHLDLLVDCLGDEPAVWIGHSFGGRLAFELAARRTDLVERLVLLDPAIALDPPIALYVAEEARNDRSYASFEEGIDRRFEESSLQSATRDLVVSDLEGFLVPDADGRWRYRYSQAAVVAAYGEMTSASPPFTSARVPTLLVRARDSYVTYDHVIDAHRAALGDLLVEAAVPGGHTLLWDAPEETAAAITEFLQR
jgi:lipase